MNKKQFFVSLSTLLVILGVGTLLTYYIQSKIAHLHTTIYEEEAKALHQTLQQLIEAKAKTTLSIATALSNNEAFKTALKKNDQNTHETLKDIALQLRTTSGYDTLWMQLATAKGVALGRSWTRNQGDDLTKLRPDVVQMIANPQPQSVISVGKFTITFKAMVPIFEGGIYLGYIELIAHFDSIDALLSRMGVAPLLLVDEKYHAQLTAPLTKRFVQKYYIATVNLAPSIYTLLELEGENLHELLEIQNYAIIAGNFVTLFTLHDLAGQKMAYYFMLKPLSQFDFSKINEFIETIAYLTLIGVAIALLFVLFFYLRKKSIEKERLYFRQIIDSSSDILIVTNTLHPLDANRHFFEFFDTYESLAAFDAINGCVCNLFEKEEGFVAKDMGEQNWVEYIMSRPKEQHKVKILYNNIPHIFSIRLRLLHEDREDIYTVVLTDITQAEAYREKLEKISQTDTLTGIGNRYLFKNSLQNEINRASRYGQLVSVLMFDIDHFKKVNDTYGHDIGDNVLIEITQAILPLLRQSDVFCRYGGEEFIIILPQVALNEARITAERIRHHIELLIIEPLERITISIGVTQWQKGESIDALLKRVDNALYLSKHEGRNRVTAL